METLKVSLAQLDVRLGRPEENVPRAFEWIEQASRSGSQLIVFPELWSCGYDLEHLESYANELKTGLWNELSQKAAACHIAIAGSLIEKDGSHFYNTSALFDSEGLVRGIYRKIHLFRTIDEDKFLTSGDLPVVADTPWGKTGLATCYDLRFPELFRLYAISGATLMILPAEWPTRRVDHWRTLIRARAIENQCIVVAVNAAGTYKTDTYAGHSAIISSWGETIVEAGEEEFLITSEIDLSEVEITRKRIPVFEDRRPDLYHNL